jgi:hypothetical protein
LLRSWLPRRKGKIEKLDKYPWMKTIKFYPLPSTRKKSSKAKRDVQKRKRTWLNLIRREATFKPNKKTRVCSRHFLEGQSPDDLPSEALPTLFPHNNWGECGVLFNVRCPKLNALINLILGADLPASEPKRRRREKPESHQSLQSDHSDVEMEDAQEPSFGA